MEQTEQTKEQQPQEPTMEQWFRNIIDTFGGDCMILLAVDKGTLRLHGVATDFEALQLMMRSKPDYMG